MGAVQRRECLSMGGIRSYCRFQVWPPSSVAKRRRSAEVIVACSASLASIPVQSADASGEVKRCQRSPSVVRRTTPARPAIHATVSEGAAPATRSLVTPLDCSCQVRPWSAERSMRPPGLRRQSTLRLGEASTTGARPARPAMVSRAAKACTGRFPADFSSAPFAAGGAAAGAAGAAVRAAATGAGGAAEAAAGDSSVTFSLRGIPGGSWRRPCRRPRRLQTGRGLRGRSRAVGLGCELLRRHRVAWRLRVLLLQRLWLQRAI